MLALSCFCLLAFVVCLTLLGNYYANQKMLLLRAGTLFTPDFEAAASDTSMMISNPQRLPFSHELRLILHSRLWRLSRILNRYLARQSFLEVERRERAILRKLESKITRRDGFQPPETDRQARSMMNEVNRLLTLINHEQIYNHGLDPEICKNERARLSSLNLKIRITIMIRRLSELEDAEKLTEGLDLIADITDLIDRNPDHDFWFNTRRGELVKRRQTLEFKLRNKKPTYDDLPPLDAETGDLAEQTIIEEAQAEAASTEAPESAEQKTLPTGSWSEPLKW